MAHRECGFTRASSLGPIAGFVREQGGSIARVFRQADLPLQIIEAPETLVPLKEQFRLLHRAARETGDPEFGARLGQNVRVQNLGAFGSWVSAAHDLDGALARSGQGLNAMLQSSTMLKLERFGPTARWSVELLEPASEGRYQHELLALCYMLDILRFYAGQQWSPDIVLTAGPKGAHKGVLERLYKAVVLSGQRVPAIQFDWCILTCVRPFRLATADGVLPPVCKGEPPIPGKSDDLGAIAAIAALSLLNGYPRLDWVASKLGVTRRSLQRRLADRGTTFMQLVERIISERAKTLVAEPGESLTAIAFQLGYSDIAHFSRAFRKWTGVSPSVYRATRMQALR